MNCETLQSSDSNLRILGLTPFPTDKCLLFRTTGMHYVVTCGKNATDLQPLSILITIHNT
jgi:hypothetical protein